MVHPLQKASLRHYGSVQKRIRPKDVLCREISALAAKSLSANPQAQNRARTVRAILRDGFLYILSISLCSLVETSGIRLARMRINSASTASWTLLRANFLISVLSAVVIFWTIPCQRSSCICSQISSAHTNEDIETAVQKFTEVGKKFMVV